MAYTKTNWIAGTTKVNPTTMNKIEQGIKDAHDDIAKITDGTTASGNASKLDGAVPRIEADAGSIVKRSSSGDIKAGAIILSNEIQVPKTTSLTDVSITCATDQDTGLNFPSDGEMEFVSNGSRKFKFSQLINKDVGGTISGNVVHTGDSQFGMIDIGNSDAQRTIKGRDSQGLYLQYGGTTGKVRVGGGGINGELYLTKSNVDKRVLDIDDVATSNVGNRLVNRDGNGDVNCRLLRQEWASADGNGAYFLTQKQLGTGDNYARPMSKDAVKDALNVNAILLSSNINLDDYKTEGVYYCPANATVTTWSNTPFTQMGLSAQACSLEIQRHAGVRQILKDYGTNYVNTYERNYYSNIWGAWRRILDDRYRATMDYNGKEHYLKIDDEGFYLQEV